MAGQPGRSGGKRAGAGRKAKPTADGGDRDMLELLQDIALGRVDATVIQVRAATAAIRYTHTATHDGGKKEAKETAAKEAGSGKFSPSAPPKLKVVNGK